MSWSGGRPGFKVKDKKATLIRRFFTRPTCPPARPPLFLLTLSLAGVLLVHESILLAIGDFLVVEDELQPADLIHVLGGDFARLDYAVKLYHQGYAPRLFITGGKDARVYRRYAIDRGADPARIDPARSWAINTYQEAQELKQFLAANPAVDSVIVVTSPYHTRRARWAFQRVVGRQARLTFAPVPLPGNEEQPDWWLDPVTRKQVISEYSKILLYRFRYQYNRHMKDRGML